MTNLVEPPTLPGARTATRKPDAVRGEWRVYLERSAYRSDELRVQIERDTPTGRKPLPRETPPPPPPPPMTNPGTNLAGTGRRPPGRPTTPSRTSMQFSPPSTAWSTWRIGARRGFLGWRPPAALELEIEWAVNATIAALEARTAQLAAERAAYDAALERWMGKP